MKNISSHLDKIAKNYHLSDEMKDKYIEEISQIVAVDQIATTISITDTILELGYGDGITTKILSEKFPNYYVIEGSKVLYDVASHQFPRVHFIHSLFEDFEPLKKFDRVLALHIFEHVEAPVDLMFKIHDWISAHGELVVIVPNAESFHRRLALEAGLIQSLDELSERDRMVGHLRVYDLVDLEADLNAANFKIVESRGLFFKPFANSQLLQLDKKIIKAMNTLALNFPPEYGANLLIRARKC